MNQGDLWFGFPHVDAFLAENTAWPSRTQAASVLEITLQDGAVVIQSTPTSREFKMNRD